jgi:hypothetical protein
LRDRRLKLLWLEFDHNNTGYADEPGANNDSERIGRCNAEISGRFSAKELKTRG